MSKFEFYFEDMDYLHEISEYIKNNLSIYGDRNKSFIEKVKELDGTVATFINSENRGWDYDSDDDGTEYGSIIEFEGEKYYIQFEYSSWDSPRFIGVTKCEVEEQKIYIVRKIALN